MSAGTDRGADGIRALLLADGAAPTRAGLDRAWPGWDAGVGLVIAADGGARLAGPLGLRVDRWVGDADSVDPTTLDALRAAGVPVEMVATEKDESDTELALLAAVAAGATDVTILGAIGGARFDHALANVGLLAHPVLAGIPARLLDDATRVTLLVGPATATLDGRPGDLVSLLPFDTAVTGVTTSGLRYALAGEPLPSGPARGLSNVRTTARATVTTRAGRLLIVETPDKVRP